MTTIRPAPAWPSRAHRPERVSIVIPAYNHARYLDQAIDSVLGQSHPDIQLIVLDDGSTDDTRDVLRRRSGRFHWETHPNMGQAATLNKGWAMSNAAVLGYLSADDYLHRDAAARAVEVLREFPDVVATYCDFNIVDEASHLLSTSTAPEFDYDAMVLRGVCLPGPGAFFRRSTFDAVGGWDRNLRHVPDVDFWLRVGLHGEFRRIPEVLAHYRMHDGSQSFSKIDERQADEIISVLNRLYREPQLPARLRNSYNRSISSAYLLSARLHLYSSRCRVGLRRALAAVACHPRVLVTPRSYRLIAGGLIQRAGQKLVWQLRRLPHKRDEPVHPEERTVASVPRVPATGRRAPGDGCRGTLRT